MTAYEKLLKCYECVKNKVDFKPEIALVLGSGLGDYADTAVEVHCVIRSSECESIAADVA